MTKLAGDRRRQLGDIAIIRLVETERREFTLAALFPDVSPEAWAPYRRTTRIRDATAPDAGLVLSVQSFLVRTRHHTIIVDTCVGDHKERWRPEWTMQTGGRLLRRLAAAGVSPDRVDYVIATHLHADHVGWNTRWADGTWVPTFPNARYLVAGAEWRFWSTVNDGRPLQHIDDSVRPIIEARSLQLVANDHAIADELRFEPTPGHTPGHVSIVLQSGSRLGVITGDVLHHPVQCAEPRWALSADMDRDAAILTRRTFLERYADRDVLVCGTHFPSPTFGRVVGCGETFRFRWDEG